MKLAQTAQDTEAAGISIDELVALAKAKRAGQDTQTMKPLAPELCFVRIGKPDQKPLSVAAAYEEYINHRVIAKNMSPKTIRHWKYMQNLYL